MANSGQLCYTPLAVAAGPLPLGVVKPASLTDAQLFVVIKLSNQLPRGSANRTRTL